MSAKQLLESRHRRGVFFQLQQIMQFVDDQPTIECGPLTNGDALDVEPVLRAVGKGLEHARSSA